jgi:hypothetical protein
MAVEQNPYDVTTPPADIVVDAEESPNATITPEDDGGVMVDFGAGEANTVLSYSDGFYSNLVEKLDDDALQEIGADVVNNCNSDLESRSEWERIFERGFDLLGLKLEETDEPFEGACTAVHPMILEAAVKFQSKATQELLPPAGPVKAQMFGRYSDEKQAQAKRIKEHMNWQLTEQMKEYYDNSERMMLFSSVMGSAFKKAYYDATYKRPVDELVPADRFVVNNFAQNLDMAERYTHLIDCSPRDMERHILSGMYADVDLPEASIINLSSLAEKVNMINGVSQNADSDPQFELLEQHCYLSIEGLEEEEDNLTLPYIVTVEKGTGSVLAIRRNYDEDDETYTRKPFFTHYKFVPGFGFYGMGYIHLLGNMSATATSAMRALIDAGQFATLPGGFKAKGVRVVGGNEPIAPGEWREVEATGVDLTKALLPNPNKEPSPTLFQMLGFVQDAGESFADQHDKMLSDVSSYGPVGTTMALLEASSKFGTSIHKRFHKAQKEELQVIARLNYEHLPSKYPFDVVGGEGQVFRKDYDGQIDIAPVSDPNIPSSAHRMMMTQMVQGMAEKSPAGMFNMEELNRTVLEQANYPNIDKIMPKKPEPQPLDPVSDIMATTKGMAIKAFAGQDHDSHIKVKMAYLQDPKNGANPIMQRIVPLLSSNIQEHSVMAYQEQMNGLTKQMSGDNPANIEKVMAEAAQKVVIANEQAAKGPPSPEEQMVMMEARRLELEDKTINFKLMDAQLDGALKDKELDIRQAEVMMKAQIDGAKGISAIEENEKDRKADEVKMALGLLMDMIKHETDDDTAKGMKVVDLISKLAVQEQSHELTKKEK